ncbi:hypothetical protein HK105_207885 [Polyrhizophydium stewartii]|uniref:Ankyrin repeat domain-containing protein n=1 Tax=Polyrhizophydium stewartii TaxID=2732419 RepID=A0ABR4MZD7_9FUNG
MAPQSHWDRLAPELKDAVLDCAGPLTQLAARAAMPVELRRRLRGAQLEALWREVVELDWQGDLTKLPRPPADCEPLLAVRDRALADRLRAAHIVSPADALRIAVRNGWDDVLAAASPADVADAAAAEGNVALLRRFLAGSPAVPPTTPIAVVAALGGHMDAVQLLCRLMPDEWWDTSLMDAAAEGGNLDLVVWLHGKRRSHDALARAAARGHLHVVRWLVDKGIGIMSVDALAGAAEGGHVQVLQMLLDRYPDYRGDMPDVLAQSLPPPHVHEWAESQGIAVDPSTLIVSLALAGRTAEVQRIIGTPRLQLDDNLVDLAYFNESDTLMRIALQQPGATLPDDYVLHAVKDRETGLLQLFIRHDRRLVGVIADHAASLGHANLVEWVHVRFPESITQNTLAQACAKGRTRAVEYLLGEIEGVAWDLEAARACADGVRKDDVLRVLDAHARALGQMQ